MLENSISFVFCLRIGIVHSIFFVKMSSSKQSRQKIDTKLSWNNSLIVFKK